MRIGGLILDHWETAEQWAQCALDMGYSAVYFPVNHTASTAQIDSFVKAAAAHDLVIAEVGVWNNTLAADKEARRAAMDYAVKQLELAEYVGARCCVNISGSHSSQWDGPHKENLTQETFDQVVDITRQIIDRVNPKRTGYSLEPMPWMFPDSAESYAALIKAIDRTGFAAHMDPVNVVNSPDKFYRTGELIHHWFDVLGDGIKSCHAKDIRLGGKLTVHLDECPPGTGELDYPVLISRMRRLAPETTLMLEHMDKKEDYVQSMAFLKKMIRQSEKNP